MFHMFFLARYCRLLEEGSFRGRTIDFAIMLAFGGVLMCAMSVYFTSAPPFLGSSLAFMMVYVWARRNDDVRMSFLGLFNFRAPYLPWVLLGFRCAAASKQRARRRRECQGEREADPANSGRSQQIIHT